MATKWQSRFEFKYVGSTKVSQDIFNKAIILPSTYNLSLKKIKIYKNHVKQNFKKI